MPETGKDSTLQYYDRHAEAFSSGTMDADMSGTRARFASYLPPKGIILDFGCGSGRDTKAFLEAGFRVDAADGSQELCARAAALTGIPVKKMLFTELDAQNRYDGIWACASILHLPKAELAGVVKKMEAALKRGGVLYASFKYGTGEGMRNGRYFTEFTEETLREFCKTDPALRILDLWVTQDVRPGREEERWVNLLARRV